MTRSMIETLLGAVVLALAGYFLFFSYSTANVGSPDGYRVYADFAGVGGLKAGDTVQISGVKVGRVSAVELAPESYLARVHIDLNSQLKLPTDTAALISSESLLGGRYLSLEPGADEEVIPENGRIQYTQAPQNLEQLLGQFIFSMQGDKKDEKASENAEPAAMPSLVEPEAPAAAQPAAPAEEALPDHP
jgi:phospholipid/cholesterol/gamma-HCH transport system substrate-binding protein